MEIEKYISYLQEGKLSTPAYVYDVDIMRDHIKTVRGIIGNKIEVCYAMKANPFVVRKMADLADNVEVCSHGELEICKKFNVPAEKIVFSGVNKTKEEVWSALEYGVGVITIESYKHFLLIKEYCEQRQSKVHVFLRLSDGAQFGLNKEVFEWIIKNREKYEYIHIKGVHFFSGTQKKKVEKNWKELEDLFKYFVYLKQAYGFCVECLEYGAGLHTPYFVNEEFDNRYEGLKKVVEKLNESSFDGKVVLELGRFLVASCGKYFTSIEDIKEIDEKKYCIVDGGIHQLNYYGQNMALRTPIIHKIDARSIDKEDTMDEFLMRERKGDWCICGSLCTYADVLVRKIFFEKVSLGDVFVFDNVGAYSATESPVMFLSRKKPGMYVYDKEIKACEAEVIYNM